MDYRDVGVVTRGALDPGKLKIQLDGFLFKSAKTGKILQIKEGDVDRLEWMQVARGFEVKVITQDGNITKFDGFKESDYSDLHEFFKSHFRKELREVELCVKGWNWGEAKFQGSLLTFLVENKRAFEIPLKEVSQVTSGKNEVTLEFHQGDEAPVSLVEMRFHIPSTEAEGDPVQEFRQNVLAQADIMQATGVAIATFPEIHSITPRGRYTIKCYPSFLQLHGKTFDYKIPYNTVTRLFLLPHNDQRQMYFVLGLDPPIRQGQTRYHFVLFQLPVEEECEVTLSLSEEELQERYEGKLAKELSGSLYEVFSRVMRVLVGKKITVPGSFKNNNNQCAITCSIRANPGYLYPLDKGFIFVHKPAVYIKFDGIASVNFARMTGGAGISRSFDFEIELKDGNVHHFSSVMKEDYNRLFEFVSEKKLRIKGSKGKSVHKVSYDDEQSSGSEHDPYLERMKAEGEERDDSESEDSDYVAGASGSDEDLEYDSAVKSHSENDSDAGSDENAKGEPRRKEAKKSAKPTKRKKEDTGGPKKKRPKKDPNAPKKPLTAFMVWLQENRASIKAKDSTLSVAEVGKKAGELWRQLEDTSEWRQKAAKLQEQYKKDLAAYVASGKASTSSEVATKSKPKTPSKKPPAKSSKKTSHTPTKVDPKKAYKSAEFVKSDEDSSVEEEEEEEEEGKPQKEEPAASAPSRSMRNKKGGSEDVGSLPSEESDAEMTSGESEGGSSDDDESD